MGDFYIFPFYAVCFSDNCVFTNYEIKKIFLTLFPFFFFNLHISVDEVFLSAVPSQATFIPLTLMPWHSHLCRVKLAPWAANLWWPTWLPTGNSPHHTDRIRGKTSNEGGFCPWPWFQLPSPQGAVTKTTTTCAVGSSTQLAMWLPWLIPDVLTQQEVRKRKFSPRQLGAPQD